MLGLRLGAKRGGNLHPEHRQVVLELGGGAGSNQHRGNRWMAKRKLKGGRLERNSVPGAYGLQPQCPLQDRGGHRTVVVVGGGTGVGQEAAVKSASDDDRDPLFKTERKQLGEADLVQQRVAAGEQETIEVRTPSQAGKHLRLVHSGTEGADQLLAAKLVEGPISPAQRLIEKVVGVVDVKDVHPLQSQAFQTRLERAHDPVVGEVENWIEGRRAKPALVWLWRSALLEQPADLRRECQLTARPVAQDVAEAALGQTKTIKRCCVEQTQTRVPRLYGDCIRVAVLDPPLHPTQGTCPCPHLRHLHAAPSYLNTLT